MAEAQRELAALRREICEAAGKRWAYPLSGDLESWKRAKAEGEEREAKRRGWEWPIK